MNKFLERLAERRANPGDGAERYVRLGSEVEVTAYKEAAGEILGIKKGSRLVVVGYSRVQAGKGNMIVQVRFAIPAAMPTVESMLEFSSPYKYAEDSRELDDPYSVDRESPLICANVVNLADVNVKLIKQHLVNSDEAFERLFMNGDTVVLPSGVRFKPKSVELFYTNDEKAGVTARLIGDKPYSERVQFGDVFSVRYRRKVRKNYSPVRTRYLMNVNLRNKERREYAPNG